MEGTKTKLSRELPYQKSELLSSVVQRMYMFCNGVVYNSGKISLDLLHRGQFLYLLKVHFTLSFSL